MPLITITFLSYLFGSLFLLLLTVTAALLLKRQLISVTLFIGVTLSLIWCLSLAYDANSPSLTIHQLLLLETLRNTGWIIGMLQQMVHRNGKSRFKPLRFIQLLVLLIAAGLTIYLPHQVTTKTGAYEILIWSGLVFSIAGIIVAEQLYRNSPHNRINKTISLGVIAILLYDLYLYSYAQLFGQLETELWQARGAINGICAGLLTFALTRPGIQSGNQQSRVTISRPVAFYTTSITTAGFFLALMAAGGYYIKLYGGNWGTVVQVTLIFSSLVCIATVFFSRSIRSNLAVYINKHFFVHKYDYRSQWLNLIHQLTDSSNNEDPHQTAIKAMVSIIECHGGILWMDNQFGSYTPIGFYKVEFPALSAEEPSDSPFCQVLREQEWVFSPSSQTNNELSNYNELLPSWTKEVKNLSLIVPLMVDSRLIGFMLLTKQTPSEPLSWEDLDLLKTVGREVASYLSRNEAAELLAQSKQFDTYNKLSAFVMHDLKNLIAQQALVVENASKHKENPAFIDDMIRTIDNSVQRMSNLLKKLQQTQPSSAHPLNIENVVVNAVKKCQDRIPPPSLRILSDSLKVVADEDNLEMIVTHIIKNAQEATPAEGYVDITIRQERQHAVIEVEDNGCGMDSEFIKNRLFRPFDTTKSGKGMGIGVYQTREFIRNLGGDVIVKSEPLVGTTFSVYLPIDFSHTEKAN